MGRCVMISNKPGKENLKRIVELNAFRHLKNKYLRNFGAEFDKLPLEGRQIDLPQN